MNDNGEFEHLDIYTPELEGGKDSKENDRASFLDLTIRISGNKFHLNLYDTFPISIVLMPYLSRNMLIKISYASIAAEFQLIDSKMFGEL